MKTKAILTCLAVTAGTFGVASANPDAFFPRQNFDGFTTAQTVVGQGLWERRASTDTPALEVVTGGLTYAPGAAYGGEGNAIRVLGESGEDVRLPFDLITPADNNTYYWSALIEWDGTQNIDGETYIAGFLATGATGSTTVRGALAVRGDSGDVSIGVRMGSSSGSENEFFATPIVANQTYAIVIKVTEVPGDDNDTADLFVFSTTEVPSTEPGTPDVTSTHVNVGGTAGDIQQITLSSPGIQQFALRQFAPSSTAPAGFPGNWIFDQVRAGSTWESVTEVETSIGEWMMY